MIDDMTEILRRLGLPKYCIEVHIHMAAGVTIPIINATFYATTDDGKIALDHDVFRILSEHFTMVPLNTNDLIIGKFNVDAEIRAALKNIRRNIDVRLEALA